MKAIKCELCGGNDLVKQNGVYVCQYCGTQYTIEEARNLLRTAEGGIDVSGSTVKVDNSGFVQKYLKNARRAKKKEDWAEVEKYYNLVEQNDPTNIEAIFYSAYGKAMQSLVDSDIYKREAAFKPFINSISIVDDNFDFKDFDKQLKFVEQMSADIFKMASSDYVYMTKKNGYGLTTYNDSGNTKTLFRSIHLEFIDTLNNIASKVAGAQAIAIYELAIKHCEAINLGEMCTKLKLKVNELDSSQYTTLAATVAEQAKKEENAKERRIRQWKWVRKHAIAIAVTTGLCLILIFSAWGYSLQKQTEELESTITAGLCEKTWKYESKSIRIDLIFENSETCMWVKYENNGYGYKKVDEGETAYKVDTGASRVIFSEPFFGSMDSLGYGNDAEQISALYYYHAAGPDIKFE